MGLPVHLYDADGEWLADIKSDGGTLPREGETVRITEGDDAGDYLVEFVRWRIPEGDIQILCCRAEKTPDTWPE